MNFIKKNKVLVAILTLVFVFIIILAIYIYLYQNNSNKYGNRLNGIENVLISDNKITNIKDKLLSNNNCNTVNYKLDGKIIKFFIDVKPETDELSLESMFNLILDGFSDSEKAFYDFEIFVTSTSKSYPVIAYKHRNNEVFSISRKEVVQDEE